MLSVWNWFRDKENRATVGFLSGIIFTIVPVAFIAYKFYFGDPFSIPDMKVACLVPRESIPDEVHTTMHRNATQFVILAKEDNAELTSKIERMKFMLYDEHADIRKYTIDIHFLQYLCQGIYSNAAFSPNEKNKLRSLCADAIIPEEQNALLKNASFEPIKDPDRIAGTWIGQYFYAYKSERAELNAVDFQVRIVRDGLKLYGGIFEKNTFSDHKDQTPELFATLLGMVDEKGAMYFRKQYEGVDGTSHAIDYEGVWDPIGGTLRGTWRQPGNPDWWGRFIMQKT